MKKRRKRIVAVVLAAAMLFTMQGTSSMAAAETVEAEEVAENSTGQTVTADTEEPEEETGAVQESETDDSDSDEPDDEESIHEDCPVCSAEDADLSYYEGVEEDTEDDEQEDTETEDSSTRVIEDLIAALPDHVTEDNEEEVRAQLDEILAIYRELTEEEQAQVDISRCLELQEALDAANAPTPIEEPSEDAVAMVEKEGEEPTYTTSLADAFTLVKTGGTITLLTNVKLTEKILLNIEYSGNIILNLNGHMIDGGNLIKPIYLGNAAVNLTICGSGGVNVSKDVAVFMNEGILTLAGGTFSSSNPSSDVGGVIVNGGTLNVTSDSVTIDRLYVGSGTVSLTAGKYTGSPAIETGSNGIGLGSLPGENYAYYGTDGKPLALDGLGVETEYGWATQASPVTVGRCTHDGATMPNEDGVTHGGDCPYCGTVFDVEPHTDTDGDGKCDGCKEQLAAKVEIGGTATYYTAIETAWAAAKGNIATVTLLENVETREVLEIVDGSAITFDGGAYTLTIRLTETSAYAITVDGGTLRMQGGTITAKGILSNGVKVAAGGTFVVTGGKIEASDNGINAAGGIVQISGGEVNGHTGLFHNGDSTVQISGGTFKGTGSAVYLYSGKVSSLLYHTDTTRYAYYQGDIPVTEGLEGKSLSAGAYTVKRCSHDGVGVKQYQHNVNTKTHTLTCLACGYTETEDCTYGTEYGYDETNHWRTCTVCGGRKNEAHGDFTFSSKKITGLDNSVQLSYRCGFCDYVKESGTLAVNIPDGSLTYDTDQALTYTLDFSDTEVNVSCQWTDAENDYQVLGIEAALPLTGISAGRHSYSLDLEFVNYGTWFYLPFTFTIEKAGVTEAMVTLTPENATYNGAAQKPVVIVRQGETTLTEGTDYEVSYFRGAAETTDLASAGDITVKIKGIGNYTETVTKIYTINKADVKKDNLICKLPEDCIYTGKAKTATVDTNGLTGSGGITVQYKKDNTGNFVEAIEPGVYYVYAVVSGKDNYNDAQIEMGSFTISYMAPPAVLYNGSNIQSEYYNGDVAVSGESADSHTYTVSDTIDGNYHPSLTISAPEGTESTVTKTLYFKDEAGHISKGVEAAVRFDRAAPTGKIAVGAKWWQKALSAITFGHYAVKEYTVTIEAEDAGGSGIDRIEYVIVTEADPYIDAGTLEAANLSWAEYDESSRPAVSAGVSQYVVYARLTDKTGNMAYISTEGILLDSTPPVVSDLTVPDDETRKDVSAGFTFKVSEAGNYYYVVLPEGSDVPSAEDIIVTCEGTLPDGKTGNVITGKVTSGSGAAASDALTVSVEAQELRANTTYTLYVTAVDSTVDITDSEKGTPAGNTGNVVQADFTTKKTLPVITEAPTVAGTYGQSVGEMTVTGGTAKGGDTVLTGTWAVSSADIDKKPSAGTAEEITVIFKSAGDSYDSVLVKVTPTVNARSLRAVGVTISEAAGTYTYTGSPIRPPVAVNTGNPSTGICLSDSGAELTADDFTVSYSNNQNAGTGTAAITITGKGNYTGSVTRKFTIGKAEGRTIPDLTGSYTDDGEKYIYTITPSDGAVYRMDENGTWQEENVFKGITPGTSAMFYAKMPENENYKEGEAKSIIVDFPKITPAAPESFALRYEANGEKDYTVIIPPTEGCEYSFDGETWSDSNEKTGVKAGETVTGYKRYKETEDYNTSSAVSDTKTMPKNSGETGSGGNESNSGGNSSGSGSHESGNSTPNVPVSSSAPDMNTNPGTETAPLRSGTRNTGNAAAGTGTGNSTAQGTGPATGIPFIKGEDGKTGWDVIRAEEEKTEDGNVIHVDMNGSAVVPGDIFDRIKGRDITITFDMGDGILWSVDGQRITTDKAGDIDFSVKTGGSTIPVDVVNTVTGEKYHIQLSLACDGEFGFTAVLFIGLGKENAGFTASLYYYRESTGELEFVCADEITEDGTVSLVFTHASDYVITIEREEEEHDTETAQTEETDKPTGDETAEEKPQQSGQPWWAAVLGVLALLAGAGVFFMTRKKRDDD